MAVILDEVNDAEYLYLESENENKHVIKVVGMTQC
jgi:hypothetical protein